MACAAARSSACAWATSAPENADCSSPKARAVTSASCRCRRGSSPPSLTTSTRSGRTPATDHIFVVLKGPRRGQPLSPAGLDEILSGARTRAGHHLTCHQLRHTCFTRLREAGMALEAIQAQAGHRSIESTRIYLHLANDWLAGEYRRACEAIDAQADGAAVMPPLSRCPRPALVGAAYLNAMTGPDPRDWAARDRAGARRSAALDRAGGWEDLSLARMADALGKARRSPPGCWSPAGSSRRRPDDRARSAAGCRRPRPLPGLLRLVRRCRWPGAA